MREQFFGDTKEKDIRIPAEKYDEQSTYNTMQHVATEVYDSETRQYRYSKCTALCQGWRYSLTFFRMSTNLLVTICKKQFEGKYTNTHLDVFQDDIILCSSNNELLLTVSRLITYGRVHLLLMCTRCSFLSRG